MCKKVACKRRVDVNIFLDRFSSALSVTRGGLTLQLETNLCGLVSIVFIFASAT